MPQQQTKSFIVLLIVILGYILVPAFLSSPDLGGILTPIFLSAILVTAVASLRRKRKEFIATCGLAIPALTFRWLTEFSQNRPVLILASTSWILLLAVTVIFILRHILTTTEVTYDTISGAICGYLLFGVMIAIVFATIELLYPGSYARSGNRILADVGHLEVNREMIRYTYFSLITLAGVGYGDMTPVSPPAQAIAPLEAIAGQFYVAVLIARLVSIHAARSLIDSSGSSDGK